MSTDLNIALDLVAALDMYDGDFGDDGVQIEDVTDTPDRKVRVTLTNGEVVTISFDVDDAGLREQVPA